MTRVAVAAASLLWAGSAWAQGVYVGGAIGAEVVRTSSTKSGGTTYDSGSGEAFAGAIRVGTFITPRVGVELEYFRPGEIESRRSAGHLPGASDSPSFASWSSVVASTGRVPELIFPSIIWADDARACLHDERAAGGAPAARRPRRARVSRRRRLLARRSGDGVRFPARHPAGGPLDSARVFHAHDAVRRRASRGRRDARAG